jgi:ATP-binding cassette subfamily B protein
MKNPITHLARRAWLEAEGRRPIMLCYLAMFLCAQVLSLAEPWVIGRMLDSVQTISDRGRLLTAVYTYAGAFLGIQVFFWLFHGPARCLERWVAFHVRTRYRTGLFHKTTQLPLQWHRDNHSGETIDKIARASTALYEFTGGSFMLIYMFLRLTGAHLLLFWFMPFAGFVALTTTAVVLTVIFRFDRVLYRHYGVLNSREAKVASAVHDYVTNMVTVITLRLESRVLGEVRRRIATILPTFKDNVILNEVKWFTTNLLIGLMITVVLSWYAYSTLAAGHVLMGGAFFTLFEYLRRIGDSFYNFAGLYGSVVRWSADVRAVEPLEAAFERAGGRARVTSPPSDWKRLDVSGLSFTYEDATRAQHHLEDIALTLERGKAIAFVGASGSGKSTCLTLLRGLQKPAAARLACDGVPLPEGLAHLAPITTLIPQDPEIFSDTIRFNITFGMEAHDLELLDAARLARFSPVIERLELGLETNIAEKGVNLSGGEKQRLALARGVFFSRESQLVLMDEPTSSVDTANERAIYSKLLELYRDRCVVSAIHKLHLLPLFDVIHVFDDGRIVESGSFEQLLAANGTLAALWRHYEASSPIAAMG